jgi:hypothetical protein
MCPLSRERTGPRRPGGPCAAPDPHDLPADRRPEPGAGRGHGVGRHEDGGPQECGVAELVDMMRKEVGGAGSNRRHQVPLPPFARQAHCPPWWAVSQGQPSAGAREVFVSSSSASPLTQAPRLHPVRACPGGCARRTYQRRQPEAPSSTATAPSRRISKPSSPGSPGTMVAACRGS